MANYLIQLVCTVSKSESRQHKITAHLREGWQPWNQRQTVFTTISGGRSRENDVFFGIGSSREAELLVGRQTTCLVCTGRTVHYVSMSTYLRHGCTIEGFALSKERGQRGSNSLLALGIKGWAIQPFRLMVSSTRVILLPRRTGTFRK